ncbi:TPA: hypothetical protein BOS_4336 [Bos taurus]|nr:TPA: hypothetical protein BOS_4336 [Bos taurus]
MVSRASHFALFLGCPLSSSTSAGVEGGLLSCGGAPSGPPSPLDSLAQARAHSTQVRPLPVTGPRVEPKPAFLAIASQACRPQDYE